MESLQQSLLGVGAAARSDQLGPQSQQQAQAGDSAGVSVSPEPFNEDETFDGKDERDIWPRRAPMPPLTAAQVRDLAARAPHHLWQTQSLLLALMLASLFTLLVLYGVMRIVSAITPADDLFRGAHTSLSSRAKYFGLPGLASMLLSVLCYLGFRNVWKKKTWRVMREAEGTAAMLRSIKEAMMCTKKRKQHSKARSSPVQPQTTAASFSAQPSQGSAIPVQSAPFMAYSSLGAAHSVSNVAHTPAFSFAGAYGTTPLHPYQMTGPLPLHRQRDSDADLSYNALQQLQLSYLQPSQHLAAGSDALLGSQPQAGAELAGDEPEYEYDQADAEGEGEEQENSVRLGAIGPASAQFGRDGSRPFSGYEPPLGGGSASPPSASLGGGDSIVPTPSLHASNSTTYLHAFDPPSSAHPYFFHASSLLRPSDVCLLRQHPSWNHFLWAQFYLYWLLMVIPALLFGIAIAVFTSPNLHAYALSFFLAGCTFLVAQATKLLAEVPALCFGERVSSSSWGVQFRLNLYVALLAILCPLMVVISHAVVIIFGGIVDTDADQERRALDALFESVYVSYLVCVASDEAFLCLRAWIRWRELRRIAGAEATAPAAASAASSSSSPADNAGDADEGGASRSSSFLSKARTALLGYSLDSELKLCCYTVLFPLCTSNLNPNVLLIAVPCVVVVCVGFKIRYDLFAPLLNEPEESAQLSAAGVPRAKQFRRGSDLLNFGSILSVLYQATQFVMMGGFIVFMLLNLDSLFGFLRPSASSSSSSTGAAQHWSSSSSTGSARHWSSSSTGMAFGEEAFGDLHGFNATAAAEWGQAAARNLAAAATAAAAAAAASRAPSPRPHHDPIALVTFDEHNRAHFDFSHTYLRIRSFSSYSTQAPNKHSGDADPGSLGADGGGGGSADNFSQTNAWVSASMMWSYVLFGLWVLRSLYFLFAHRVKAVRTAPWRRDEKHLPPAMRAEAAGGGAGGAAVTGPLEEYITAELNPDKLGAVASALSRRRRSPCCMLLWWSLLHLSLFAVALMLMGSATGIFMAFWYGCTSSCDSSAIQSICLSTCYDQTVIVMVAEMSLIFSPIPLLIVSWPTAYFYSCVAHWVNRYFLGVEQPYPGKFFANPCWLCTKRNLLRNVERRRKIERKRALQRQHPQDWRQRWVDEEEARRRQIGGEDDAQAAVAMHAAMPSVSFNGAAF